MNSTTALVFASLAVTTAAVAGPVTSTMKTMSEVEPRIAINATNTPGNASALYVISQPGSYYLTGNIVGVAGKHGIVIGNVIDVTTDLNGFRLVGVAGSLDGVSGISNGVNVTVRNGIVNFWGQDGIDLGGTKGGQIENVTAYDNGQDGIEAGVAYIVSNCSAHTNAGDGIRTGRGTTVVDCSSSDNTLTGIEAGSECVVRSCSTSGNDGTGVLVANGSTVQGCASRQNGIDGVSCSSSCFILNNVSTANGVAGANGAGIFMSGSDNRVEGNVCTLSDFGVQATGTGNIIIRNTCSGNTTFNWTIAAGNAVGPIVQATTNAGVINGNTYAGSLGSTDPNANFTY